MRRKWEAQSVLDWAFVFLGGCRIRLIAAIFSPCNCSLSQILFAPDPFEFYLDIVDEAEENYLYEEDIIPLILVYQKNPSIVNSILSIYHQQNPATATPITLVCNEC